MDYYLERLLELGYREDFIKGVLRSAEKIPTSIRAASDRELYIKQLNVMYSKWRFYLTWNTPHLNELAKMSENTITKYGDYSSRKFRQEKDKQGINSDDEKSLYQLIHQNDERARDTTVWYEYLILVLHKPMSKYEYSDLVDRRTARDTTKYINNVVSPKSI